MAKKIVVFAFILCVILCQEIVAVFLEDVGESNSLFRRKRVINLEPGGDIPLSNGVAPYVVNIKEHPGNFSICVGTILSKRTVITSAPCVARAANVDLRLYSSSTTKHRGILHQIIDKKVYIGNNSGRNGDGIALLIVQPAFQFNLKTNSINLHEELLLLQTPGTVFGWGCNPTEPRGTNYRYKLRLITVPIMHHRDCVNCYRDHVVISDKYICTYHPHKRCGHIDGGAPLVVNNSLTGVYLWTASIQGRLNPDVFVDIQNLEYGSWIRNNIVYNI